MMDESKGKKWGYRALAVGAIARQFTVGSEKELEKIFDELYYDEESKSMWFFHEDIQSSSEVFYTNWIVESKGKVTIMTNDYFEATHRINFPMHHPKHNSSRVQEYKKDLEKEEIKIKSSAKSWADKLTEQ